MSLFSLKKRLKKYVLLIFITAILTGCGSSVLNDTATPQVSDDIAPEHGHSKEEKEGVISKNFMVAAANPYATKAGEEILLAGGNAIDAAVAIQLMLGLVEPQSSGLGGGALLLYYDATAKNLVALDGRETAPLAANSNLFLGEDGEPLKFWDAVIGGRSVGTPGTVKLLEAAHKLYGKKEWASLFQSSINLANEGFIVSKRLSSSVERAQESLRTFASTNEYFLPNGQPLRQGRLLKNPAYAQTLEAIANNGSAAFYHGAIARNIVNTVKTAATNQGVLSLEDLARYEIKKRETICTDYRQYEVCGFGPPTSGGIAIGQILGILNHFDLRSLGEKNAESWRLIGDASRLAFADRGLYVADSDFVEVPIEGLLDVGYLAKRADLLRAQNHALDSVEAGRPSLVEVSDYDSLAPDESIELPSTSHFVIVDSWGNVVSMTTTIENGFGSRLMTNGFLLNNELTDFSFRAKTKEGKFIANRVEPLKRPRSSMSPTIVMKNKRPYMAIGSPGGSRIIGFTAKTIIAHIDWDKSIQDAISMPHAVNRFGSFDVEQGSEIEALKPALEQLGYEVNVRDLNSGLHGIIIEEDKLEGGADPRREGVVRGQ